MLVGLGKGDRQGGIAGNHEQESQVGEQASPAWKTLEQGVDREPRGERWTPAEGRGRVESVVREMVDSLHAFTCI